MPIYEYRCNACNHQFELRQKFSDAPAAHCPKCDGAVHKKVSASAFSLKGSGWFAEGYGSKAEATPTESDTTAGTATAVETAPTVAAPAETTASQAATPASPTPSQPETKNVVAQTPATTEKAKKE